MVNLQLSQTQATQMTHRGTLAKTNLLITYKLGVMIKTESYTLWG